MSLRAIVLRSRLSERGLQADLFDMLQGRDRLARIKRHHEG
jgi:hypothetical protein